MTRIISARLAIAVVFLILLASVGGVSANATPVAPGPQVVLASQVDLNSFSSKVASYKLASASLSPGQSASIREIARQHAVAKGPVTLDAKSLSVRVLNGEVIVSFALAGTDVDPASNLSVVFDSQLRYLATEQVTYTADQLGGGSATFWTNGVFVTAKSVSAAQAAAAAFAANAKSQGMTAAKTTSFYNKFSACLDGWEFRVGS